MVSSPVHCRTCALAPATPPAWTAFSLQCCLALGPPSLKLHLARTGSSPFYEPFFIGFSLQTAWHFCALSIAVPFPLAQVCGREHSGWLPSSFIWPEGGGRDTLLCSTHRACEHSVGTPACKALWGQLQQAPTAPTVLPCSQGYLLRRMKCLSGSDYRTAGLRTEPRARLREGRC